MEDREFTQKLTCMLDVGPMFNPNTQEGKTLSGGQGPTWSPLLMWPRCEKLLLYTVSWCSSFSTMADWSPEATNQNESLPIAFVRYFATLMRDVTDKGRKSAKSLFVHMVAVDSGDHLRWSFRDKGIRLAKHSGWNSAVCPTWLIVVLPLVQVLSLWPDLEFGTL